MERKSKHTVLSQLNNPVKQDWTEQVKTDLFDFKIGLSFNEMKHKSKKSFKKYVKTKALEFEFESLMLRKQSHSKMKDLNYSKLEMQKILKARKYEYRGGQNTF